MVVRLTSRAVLRLLAWVIGALVALHALGQLLQWRFGSGFGLVRLFDLNQERTVPTFFAALLMLFAAGLLALIAVAERHGPLFRPLSWAFLSAAFLFLPYDELFAVHERLNGPVQKNLQTSGALGFGWVLPYALAVLAVGGLMLRLLKSLPRDICLWIVAGGAVFLGGAIGVEMVSAQVAETAGMASAAYMVCVTIEELLEMVGMAVFIKGLLDHLGQLQVAVRFDGFSGSTGEVLPFPSAEPFGVPPRMSSSG